MLIADSLEAEGYVVETIARGDEAERRLTENPPDLLILDWMLPGVSGIEICRRLRARETTRTLPVIMVTARNQESERVRGLAVGADDYVVTVLVVDDEAPARQRLVDLLRKEPMAETILEAGNGLEAIDAIGHHRPALVFLDVQMPELDGLGVMDGVMNLIGPEAVPLTVFVTAYDQHAVRAFEANALDYLLKPFSDERYEATMARVRNRLEERSLSEFGMKLARMISAAPAQAASAALARPSGRQIRRSHAISPRHRYRVDRSRRGLRQPAPAPRCRWGRVALPLTTG